MGAAERAGLDEAEPWLDEAEPSRGSSKVIFQLHSKNEENNLAQQALGSCHEKEMEVVLKQANDIILKQKDEIAKLKEGKDLKEKIK